MDVNNILSTLENIIKKAENKDGKAESIKMEFDNAIGISKEQHDKVDSLLETYTDAEECIEQYNDQIDECTETIKDLNEAIQCLENELQSLTDPIQQAAKRREIDEKKDKRLEQTNKRERLRESRDKEETNKNRTQKKFQKLTGKNITDDIKNAFKSQNTKLIANASASGILSKGLGKLKVHPAMIAVEGLIKAIEFGIGKATEYTRLNAENLIRTINATTTVSLNEMKASLASWQDAVSGAYESQELAISSALAMLEAQNANQLASMKLANTWTNWIPIWGEVNKYQETALEMEQKLAETRMSAASKIIAQTVQFTKKTDEYLRKQDKAIHLFQTENGMSANQTNIFGQRMLNEGEVFAQIGRTIEDALKMQSNFTSQSGRAVNFSNDDYVKTMATGRLVGDDNIVNFQSQMQLFNHSISDAADIMYDMYKDVNKMGLSQKKVTKDVLANLKLANKYNFKNGTKGFIELAKWAENARFNLGSLGNMIEKVETGGLEGVITQSAKLQVLGGGFSMNADPFRMAYLAGNDPEGYAKYVKDMFKGIGALNKETGETHFNWADSQRIRAAAEALGMSTEDARSMIREDNKKSVVQQQMRYSTLSKEEQSAVANKAQRDAKTGEWYVEKIGGGRINVGDVQSGDIQNILSADNDEASVQYAKNTMGIVDKIENTTREINAKIGALTFENFQKHSDEYIKTTLEAYSKNIVEITQTSKQVWNDILNDQKKMLGEMGKMLEQYTQAKITVDTNGKLTSTDIGEDLRNKWRSGHASKDEIKNLKKNPEYRKGMTLDEMKKLRKTDIREGADYVVDWHRDTHWVAGEEGDTATDYRAYPREQQRKDMANAYATFSSMPFKDGLISNDNQSMSVAASNITKIHDGTVKLAQSDPKDSAIFAKAGGPFDTLFNDVFRKVDEIHNGMWYNQPSSSYAKKVNSVNSIINGGDRFSSMTNHYDPFTASYETYNQPSSSYAKKVNSVYNNQADSYIMAKPMESNFENILQSDSMREFTSKTGLNPYAYSNKEKNAIGNNEPINVNIQGELNLKSNGQSFDIMKALENDPVLVRHITHLITESISKKINGGRATFNGVI